jgi:hypothetical protein
MANEYMGRTVLEAFGLIPVGDYKLSQKTCEKLGYKSTHNWHSPSRLIGLELEIENFPDRQDREMPAWVLTEDGSLRNTGCEVVTKPFSIMYADSLLRHVYKAYGITEDNNYSDRCSVHVHVNCQDLTIGEVQQITLLYSTVERLLFKFIGKDRENNIFCVPWYQAGCSANLISKSEQNQKLFAKGWQKYTALNLIPLADRGTIEFRHLYGTCDVDKIITWLQMIDSMFGYVQRVPYAQLVDTITKMNTLSNYDAFIYDVFRENSRLLTGPEFRKALTLGVIDSKMMLKKEDGMVGALTPDILAEAERQMRAIGNPVATPMAPRDPRDQVRNRLPPQAVAVDPRVHAHRPGDILRGEVVQVQGRNELVRNWVLQGENAGVQNWVAFEQIINGNIR